AVDSARHADATEIAAVWQAETALRESQFGNAALGHQNAAPALALLPGREVRSLAALALARAGYSAQAKRLAENLDKDCPANVLVQRYWLPSIRAALELNAHNVGKAVEILDLASPLELGHLPV